MRRLLMNALCVNFYDKEEQEFNKANSKLFEIAFASLAIAFVSHQILNPVFRSEQTMAATPPWFIYTTFSITCANIGVFTATCIQLKKAANKVISEREAAEKRRDIEYAEMRKRFYEGTERLLRTVRFEDESESQNQSEGLRVHCTDSLKTITDDDQSLDSTTQSITRPKV